MASDKREPKNMAEGLRRGLQEAVAYSKGSLKAKEHTVEVPGPAPKWSPLSIRRLRKEVYGILECYPINSSGMGARPKSSLWCSGATSAAALSGSRPVRAIGRLKHAPNKHTMVGVAGFEPATPCTPSKCASQAALYADVFRTEPLDLASRPLKINLGEHAGLSSWQNSAFCHPDAFL
jgi:hypothetical protein